MYMHCVWYFMCMFKVGKISSFGITFSWCDFTFLHVWRVSPQTQCVKPFMLIMNPMFTSTQRNIYELVFILLIASDVHILDLFSDFSVADSCSGSM